MLEPDFDAVVVVAAQFVPKQKMRQRAACFCMQPDTLLCTEHTLEEPVDLSLNILSGICAIISDAAYPQVSHWETVTCLLFDKGAAAAKGRV